MQARAEEREADALRVGARARGQRIHPRYSFRRNVPPTHSEAVTALNQAARAVFPWHGEHYPGIERGMFEIFRGRAKIDTIRKWRNGKRKAPLWARELLKAEIEKRIAALTHGLGLL